MNLSRFTAYRRTYIRPTPMRFTVALQCCDPPVPVATFNTNDEVEAFKAFADIRAENIQNGGGGEFECVLWRHDGGQKIETMRTTDEQGYYVYNVNFPNSTKLKSFGYMDLHALESVRVQEFDGEAVTLNNGIVLDLFALSKILTDLNDVIGTKITDKTSLEHARSTFKEAARILAAA